MKSTFIMLRFALFLVPASYFYTITCYSTELHLQGIWDRPTVEYLLSIGGKLVRGCKNCKVKFKGVTFIFFVS